MFKNMFKKIIISVFFCLFSVFFSLSAASQDTIRSEFSVNLGGGISGFAITSDDADNISGFTGTVGLHYTFFFTPRWGAGLGVNLSIHNSVISIDDYNREQSTFNVVTGNPFNFLVVSSDYRETYQAVMLTIPLMFQYRAGLFYTALGGKACVPFSASSRQEGSFSTSGYFRNLNVTYENMPHLGFVNNSAFPDNKIDLSMKPFLMMSAELGFRWRLGDKTSLYTGIYGDLGFLNRKSEVSEGNLVTYQPSTPSDLLHNAAINSHALALSPFSVGVMFRLAY